MQLIYMIFIIPMRSLLIFINKLIQVIEFHIHNHKFLKSKRISTMQSLHSTHNLTPHRIGIDYRIFFFSQTTSLTFKSVSNMIGAQAALEIVLESNRLICKKSLRIDSRESILLCSFNFFRMIPNPNTILKNYLFKKKKFYNQPFRIIIKSHAKKSKSKI